MVSGLYWLLAAGFLIIAAATMSPRSEPKLPRLGPDLDLFNITTWLFRSDFGSSYQLIEQAYQRFKDTNFMVRTMMGDQVVLAPKFLTELRMLPESKLSSSAALVDETLGMYSGVDIIMKGHLSSDICRGQLTKNLPYLLPYMAEELKLAISEFFSECEVGKPISYNAYELVSTMIHSVSSRVFVGTPFCYDKAWVEAVTNFPLDVEAVKTALLRVPAFLRPLVAPLLPVKRRLARDHANIRKLLFPSSELAQSKEDLTVLKFLLQTSKDSDADSLSSRLLVLTAAALHTSSMATVNVLYDLCAMPEYIEPLRAEAQTAFFGDGGVWKVETIKKLRLLDSFLKESQRLNSTSCLGFSRKVMSEIRLSDGMTVLPAGTTISMAAGAMARDSAYYNDPLRFDGYRFFKSEQVESEYTGIEAGNLSWGSGRFTCPGRWYASAMIKMLVATLILEYDFGYPEGQSTRPPSIQSDIEVLPDFGQNIIFRKRQTLP